MALRAPTVREPGVPKSARTLIEMPELMDKLSQRIAGLSPTKRALLELRLKNASPPGPHVIPRIEDRGSAPMSFAQQRLWFLDLFEPGMPAYNIPIALRLTGPLRIPLFEESLNEIVRRHESLRTTFATESGQPVQVIHPALTFTLPVIELAGLPEEAREAEILRIAAAECQRPFDLTRGPLLRVTLLRLARDEHVLLLIMHHIICDGWSLSVLVREMAALYDARVAESPAPLAEPPIQYADYAVWQRQWLQGSSLEAQLAYWRQRLGGRLPVLDLPTDRPRPAIQTVRGATQSWVISPALTESLRGLGREQGTTLFMTLLAAFQTLLHRYAGQDDILVGSPVAGRTRIETEGLIGCFVNTLVLRSDLSADPTFRALLSQVRERALEAYSHQDLPFEKLVEELQPERSLSRTPLFQAMFVLQNSPIPPLEFSGVRLSQRPVDSGTARFDLTLSVVEDSDSLKAAMNYNTDLFDKASIERMLRHFETLLTSIVDNPDQRVSTLQLMTDEERHHLLADWNDTRTDSPNDLSVHERFEAQVRRGPDAPAIVFGTLSVTYGELNRRANQLAHHLRALGGGSRCARRYLPRALSSDGRRNARSPESRGGVRPDRSDISQ